MTADKTLALSSTLCTGLERDELHKAGPPLGGKQLAQVVQSGHEAWCCAVTLEFLETAL